jgi:hypothetical protein
MKDEGCIHPSSFLLHPFMDLSGRPENGRLEGDEEGAGVAFLGKPREGTWEEPLFGRLS